VVSRSWIESDAAEAAATPARRPRHAPPDSASLGWNSGYAQVAAGFNTFTYPLYDNFFSF
jgi:hypothetical protein